MDPAPPPPDRPTEPVPRRRDERRAIPVDMDAHQAWATGLFRHVHRTLLGPHRVHELSNLAMTAMASWWCHAS